MGKYQSGQMGQTVNLLAYAFGGSNPSLPTTLKRVCGSSSVDRALAFQAGGRGFEPRFPLNLLTCCNSSVVEHFLGKEEVLSSTLSYSSASILKSRIGGKTNIQFIYKIRKLWLKKHLCAPNRT